MVYLKCRLLRSPVNGTSTALIQERLLGTQKPELKNRSLDFCQLSANNIKFTPISSLTDL